ncbi:MAG TPA: hydrogenase, partial [Ignavibacteriales bacterium]|nr:hydrogenase [Ignavibacteriales bacterium]
MKVDYTTEAPVIQERLSLAQIQELVAKPLDTKPDKKFFIALTISGSLLLFGAVLLAITFYKGIGLWGNNEPVGWGFPIINFVFWVGIGHAGTLISAILFLLRQKWRTGIARFAEAMTIFAVMCAGIFPIIHLGRPWLAGYLVPYPNQHGMWVNFTSP